MVPNSIQLIIPQQILHLPHVVVVTTCNLQWWCFLSDIGHKCVLYLLHQGFAHLWCCLSSNQWRRYCTCTGATLSADTMWEHPFIVTCTLPAVYI